VSGLKHQQVLDFYQANLNGSGELDESLVERLVEKGDGLAASNESTPLGYVPCPG
jgi:hypothetical protein